MMNLPGIEADLKLALKETPNLGLGVHLNLTCGDPLLPAIQVPSLIDRAGTFLGRDLLATNLSNVSATEARGEWRAQISKFVSLSGRPPTHLDAHHHCAYLTPGLFSALLDTAKEFGCAIRLPITTDQPTAAMVKQHSKLLGAIQEFAPPLLAQSGVRHTQALYASFYDIGATQQTLTSILHSLSEGISEIVCHVGFSDSSGSAPYNQQSENELKVVCSAETGQLIRDLKIVLVNFNVIAQ